MPHRHLRPQGVRLEEVDHLLPLLAIIGVGEVSNGVESLHHRNLWLHLGDRLEVEVDCYLI